MADLEQKTVTLPSGLAVTFRRPGPLTQSRCIRGIPSLASQDASPTIARAVAEYRAKKAGNQAKKEKPVVAMVTIGDLIDNVEVRVARLCMCAIDPKLTTDYPAPDGKTSLEALSAKDFEALLLAWTEFEDEKDEAAEIAPLSEAGTLSSSSTSSGEPTATDPALSSVGS